MFLGIILLCTVDTTDINDDNCILYTSPTTYSTEIDCLESTRNAILSEQMEINSLALNLELRNAECINVSPFKIENSI